MAQVGRNVPNTISKAPITFAMIETCDSADCNARKSQWLRYGFKDVTPLFGSQSTVPSINDSMVGQGRQMLKAMATVGADWFMISGHHGALYSSDYNSYTTDGSAEVNDEMTNLDWDRLHDEEEYCGFFNNAYHEAYWDNGTRTHHVPADNLPPYAASCIANAVYLRTAETAPDSICSIDQDNPVFDSTSHAPAPKGIILSACNTLSYKHARKTWSGYFPNAVVIGTLDCIVSGTWVSTAIASAAMTNESFWRDPQSILDQPGKCDELERQLTAAFPSSSQIGVMYKNRLYRPGESVPAF